MQTQSLLERTYCLLDSTDLTYREVAEGASVDMNWLAKLKQRQIIEPGVLKIQRVHDFLDAQCAPHQPDQQVDASDVPNPSHKLGEPGNG
jgi:hypothetical protein